MEQCLPKRSGSSYPADNFFRHCVWRMLVIGTRCTARLNERHHANCTRCRRNSGMFMHSDGLNSATWQAQMFGKKRWIICSPDMVRRIQSACRRNRADWCTCTPVQAPYMYMDQIGKLDAFNPDYEKFPLFRHANCSDYLASPGEIVFYPRCRDEHCPIPRRRG